MQHLKQYHQKVNDEYIKDEIKRCRIARNGQVQFWCGFCRELVKLEKWGLDAHDERFNHVDDRHFKNGQRISEWVPVDGHRPKGLEPEDTSQESVTWFNQDGEEEEEQEADVGEGKPHQESATKGMSGGALPSSAPKSQPKRIASPICSQAPPVKKHQRDKQASRYCVSKHHGVAQELSADVTTSM